MQTAVVLLFILLGVLAFLALKQRQKVLGWILIGFAVIFFLAFLGSLVPESETAVEEAAEEITQETEATTEKKGEREEHFSNQNYGRLWSNPESYKGAAVDITGKVFVEPERDDRTISLQIYVDPRNLEWNTIVLYGAPELEVRNGDFIHLTGTVQGEFRGENPFGAELVVPVIIAHSLKVVSAVEVIAPTKFTVDVDQTLEQHSIALTVEKIEFTDSETRVFVKLQNNSQSTARFYTFDAKAVQGERQFETTFNYDVEYPEVQSEILPGIVSEGIVLFKPLSYETGSCKLYFEVSSDDYGLDFKAFVFEVVW